MKACNYIPTHARAAAWTLVPAGPHWDYSWASVKVKISERVVGHVQSHAISWFQTKLLERTAQATDSLVKFLITYYPPFEYHRGIVRVVPGYLGQGDRHRYIWIIKVLRDMIFVEL